MDSTEKTKVVQILMENNYLVQPEVLPLLDDNFDRDFFFNEIVPNLKPNKDNLVLTKDNFFDELDKFRSKIDFAIKVENNYSEDSYKREIRHFIDHFRVRFQKMRDFLVSRPELRDAISISRLYGRKDEKVSMIGIVSEKRETAKGNCIITIEDTTGSMKVVVNRGKQELKEAVDSIVLDEVIGITGMVSDTIVFANKILFPDAPLKELKKCPDDVYVAFISDVHVGSNMFLEKEFVRFISWLNGEVGNEEHKKIASKIRYLFIVGDLIDGVGIYPGQDEELVIKDVREQYDKFAEYFNNLKRKDIHIIVCGGNHDALRIAEPQPQLDMMYASKVYEIPNIKVVSNPALVTIHKTEKFPGFDVLMYHGYSFDYYIANVDRIRNNGGYDRADLVMEFLLQKRHLAPTHGSSLYIPYPDKDPLIIDKIPDFFVTGHIHKSNVGMYKSTSLISGSCWQAKTDFQEKVGHNPEPCRVPVVNLRTRETKMLRFDDD